jgi:GMP synthase-like glutamine amidotransferase
LIIGMRRTYPSRSTANPPHYSDRVRVLSVTHGPTVPGGVFDEAVEAGGHALERWQVPDGDVPDSAAAYDAVMVFGGSMHPDQDDHFHWLAHEESFLKDVLAADVPVFGVCLGAQMLARAAGAAVGPAREAEIGWLDVSLTAAGADDPVLGALPPTATVFQWHHYTFALPPGAAALAESEVCLQSFRLDGRAAWGIQFHAEVTSGMVETWVDEDPAELPMSPGDLLAESGRRMARSNAQGRALAEAFLSAASSR